MSDDASPSRPDPGNPASGSPSPSSHGMAFRPPSIEEMNAALPQYEFVQMIGVGGMGAVYKARQPKLNRFVAIKILPPIPDDELGFTERFEREAQSMAQLSHPHIVSVFDFGETNQGQLYFVMEFIEGADLHQLISGGELTLDHFYGWIPQICDAIHYAHGKGIVHRDIKPANILIDKEGRVRIADFGLAKLIDADQPQTALTRADLSMGTPDYASPEQMEASDDIDWRSDIYSLGVLMYQMLTGKLPRGAYPMPSEIHQGIDDRLDEVVLRAMQTEPSARFQNATEISDLLNRIQTSPLEASDGGTLPASASPPDSKPARTSVRKSRSHLPLVGAIVGVSLLVGLVVMGAKNQWLAKHDPATSMTVEDDPSPAEKPKRPSAPSERGPKGSEGSAANNGAPKGPSMNQKPPQGGGGAKTPRDFSQRSGMGNGNGRTGNFEKFRDKLGRKPALDVRRSSGNLLLINRSGKSFESSGALAQPPEFEKPVHQLALGQSPLPGDSDRRFAVALLADGSLQAWGSDEFNQLKIPESLERVFAIDAGPTHAVALQENGQVVAWGDNRAGQSTVPPDLADVAAIGAGRDFSVALLEDGTVRAWGAPAFVEGAPGSEVNDITAIATGFSHVVALRESGEVITWGTNEFDQLKQPKALRNVAAIAATFGDTFALTYGGRLIRWGASGGDSGLPEEGIERIYGTGETLVAQDDDKNLIVFGRNGRWGNVPGVMRSLPKEAEMAISEDLIFAYRPTELNATVVETTGESSPSEPVPTPELDPLSTVSETEAGLEIARLQEQFEQAYHDQVSNPWSTSIQQLNDFYLNHLELRQKESAASSDLDTALVWRTEAEMVRAGEPIPESDDPGLLADLRELRQTYRQKAEEFATTRSSAETALLEKYIATLQSVQDRFTSEQKLDDALEIRTFRESLE